MAFSILRNCARFGKHVGSKNAVIENVLKNAKMETNRSMLPCRCSSQMIISPTNHLTTREYSKHAKHTHAERKYQSDSESDSDLEWIGHRGESDFWRRKIRTFHGILDLNRDGVISFDDFKILSERFINLGHLEKAQVKKFQDLLQDLWEKQFGEISPYNLVSVEKYLENMHHVLNDKNLVRKAHSFLPYLFKAVDKDRSGAITVEEFKLFFDVLGLNEQDAILAFRAIDSNGDGRISQKEFVRHGRDFFVTEDEDRISKYFWGPLVDH
ncbi:unnamed protein product [Phaedon cochleariae]|uniref:EF-hand domain-containing protein n=1 Tax=Phaedon cochleariae TaxID=80249 RepID=A0A9N9SE45_PHACE|nr:unnamed protein product [Phaedon cochleariae]